MHIPIKKDFEIKKYYSSSELAQIKKYLEARYYKTEGNRWMLKDFKDWLAMKDVRKYDLPAEVWGREQQNREATVAHALGCGATILGLATGVGIVVYQVLNKM